MNLNSAPQYDSSFANSSTISRPNSNDCSKARMAPPNNQKRAKGVQIFRPFIYGTTAKLFDPVTNPKPEGAPADHTHSWTVFVKGVDDTDITYWCKKVQFKLHESIPNPLRSTLFPSLLCYFHPPFWVCENEVLILPINSGREHPSRRLIRSARNRLGRVRNHYKIILHTGLARKTTNTLPPPTVTPLR